MDWKLEIKKVTNGYVVSWREEDGDNEIHAAVFEEPETATGELEAMKYLLLFVMEHFGVFYSKHNAKNLIVEIQDNTQEA